MNKTVVLTIFAFLFLGVIFTAINIKGIYKVIPVNANKEVTAAPYSDWLAFTPDSKEFKVMFPAYPQSAEETVPIPASDKKRHYMMFVSQMLNNTICMVSQVIYPADYDFSDPKGIMHDIVNQLLQGNPNNRIKSSEDTTFQGYPAYDFQITSKEFNIAGKAFIHNKTVYLLTYIAKQADFNLDDYKHFIDSFELTDKENVK